jgi:23S rRNA (pseudouridine1915-N3)-methyltransferase
MLDITIVAIGKIKDAHYLAAFSEYVKRLKPYARLEVSELPAASFSLNNQAKARDLEGRAITEFLFKNSKKQNSSQVYLLAERGKTFTSPEFASWLDKNQSLILVVGGALGFSPELYQRYPQISLSSLTFPHELARVVLVEQLYRAATIINNKSYHY